MESSRHLQSWLAMFSLILLFVAAWFYDPHAQTEKIADIRSLVGFAPDSSSTTRSIVARQNPGVSIPLRLLPIGDSITEGYGASDKNGWRLALHNFLSNAGYNIDFIGSLSGGDNNPDNQHEGFGGYTINRILARVNADRILGQHPNIVLIHVGTNDINSNTPDEPYDQAPARLGALIDTVLCEDATAIVLVAMIIQIPAAPDRLRAYNAAIPGVVAERYRKGFKIRVVDQTGIGGSDLADGLHPNDGGYVKMAQNWFNAIRGLPADWFAQPAESAVGGAQTCARDSLYWTSILSDRWIASGAKVPGDVGEPLSNNITINGGTTYLPVWTPIGTVATGLGKPGDQTVFLDVDGDGKADYGVLSPEGALTVSLNKGGGSWQLLNSGEPIAAGAGVTHGIYFADVNGDKRDDYIVVRDGGLIEVFINGGGFFTTWQWEAPVPLHTVPGVGPYDLVFGDLNGDGRADFLVNNTDGSIDAYLQTGSGNTFTWTKCTNLATSIGNPNIRLIRLDDDRRADFISIDDVGGLTGWLNLPVAGNCGDIFFSSIRGRQGVANGAAPGPQVHLADYDGDGRADYLVVSPADGAVEVFLNQGVTDNPTTTIQGPERVGPGGLGADVRLADLDGDGRDDYLAVGPKGEVLAYINAGEVFGGWSWLLQADGGLIATGHAGATRHQIHFADINGDGKADYLAVNDETGAVFCYYNGGPGPNGGWIWNPAGEIASGGGEGVGVRFADLDGDGRADYIWLDKDATMFAYYNRGVGDRLDGWFPINDGKPLASGSGAKRADVHFMDYDGDGMADFAWVHPEDGSVDVWFGGGAFGGGWLWWFSGKIAAGAGTPGDQITFGRLGTSGRSDYVVIEPSTAALRGFYNECFKVIGSGGAGSANFDGTCLAAPFAPPSAPDPGAPAGPTIPDSTAVNGQGQTVISGTNGIITVPTGIYTVTTIVSGGKTITYTPPAQPDITSTNNQGQTVISGTNGIITIPTGLGSVTTITSGGKTITYTPPPPQPDVTSTNAQGQTVISGSRGVVTLPTGISSDTTITSNGLTITIVPDRTTTNAQGQTIISNTGGVITLPTDITQATTVTNSDGKTFTFVPPPPQATSSSSSSAVPPPPFLYPVYGNKPDESGDNDVYTIPCDIWFFDICIRWLDVDITGWRFPIPPPRSFGPFPPPPFSIKGIEIHTSFPLPPIPKVTIGPNGKPTRSPSNKPTDCTTITGEVCLTTISTIVSSTSTTSTTLSTCLSVYGCEVSDSASTTVIVSTSPGCTYKPSTVPDAVATTTTTLAVSVPSGSECVSSVLVTTNGTPSQSCVSSRPTLTPQTISNVVCHDESALSGHGDISGDSVGNIAVAFCQFENNYATNSTGPWPEQSYADGHGINYRYQVAWKPNCREDNATPNILNPLNEDIRTSKNLCYYFMQQDWSMCANGGIGGYTDVGCLRYNFVGGLGDGAPVPAGFGWI